MKRNSDIASFFRSIKQKRRRQLLLLLIIPPIRLNLWWKSRLMRELRKLQIICHRHCHQFMISIAFHMIQVKDVPF